MTAIKTKPAAEPKKAAQLVLKVAEAEPKDVGRGIARLDPEDMAKLAAAVGDIVEVKGKRATVAKLMPTFQLHRGQGIVYCKAPGFNGMITIS